MSTRQEYLEDQLKRMIDKARDITQVASDEGRTMTDGERMQVEGYISECNDLKRRIADLKHQEVLLREIEKHNTQRDIEAEMDAMEAYKKAIAEEEGHDA